MTKACPLGRTGFTVRAELARHTRTTQTIVVLTCAALLPVLLVIAFTVASSRAQPIFGDIEQLATASGGNFVVFVLFASCRIGMPVVVALFFGTAIASEAAWRTLGYLLAIPVPRHRLLRVKACAAWIRSATVFVVLGLSAVLAGCVVFGTGPAVTPDGESVSFGHCLLLAAQTIGYELVHLVWVGTAALVVGVSTDRAVIAWAVPLAASNVSQILDDLPVAEPVRQFLPSHFGFAWLDLAGTDPEWTNVSSGALSALLYGTVLYQLALHRFERRDISW